MLGAEWWQVWGKGWVQLQRKMSQVLGVISLLDFTTIRSILVWHVLLNLWTVYFFNFPNFFRAAVNRWWLKPRILNVQIQGSTYINIYFKLHKSEIARVRLCLYSTYTHWRHISTLHYYTTVLQINVTLPVTRPSRTWWGKCVAMYSLEIPTKITSSIYNVHSATLTHFFFLSSIFMLDLIKLRMKCCSTTYMSEDNPCTWPDGQPGPVSQVSGVCRKTGQGPSPYTSVSCTHQNGRWSMISLHGNINKIMNRDWCSITNINFYSASTTVT